jgi:hypothetical protein
LFGDGTTSKAIIQLVLFLFLLDDDVLIAL